MKLNKEYTATLGLLMITVWAALQYVLLQNIPDSVSTFAFLFITNFAGAAVLSVAQFKKLKLMSRKIMVKGVLLAAELIGFNFFMLLGSKGIDSVIVSSLVSMYFIFVTPILILLKKKVSFRSAVASAVAILALLLMFNADFNLFFSSLDVLYLLIADLFFAAYVITISIVGENEDSTALTISQMLFCILFSLIGWVLSAGMGNATFALPTNGVFWITVLFIGIFIRALYGLIQISCQKYVKPVNASLIFSSEIIITLITNPFMSRLLGTEYTKATIFQIVGCFLFVIAVLVVDDTFMGKLGYKDMDTKTYVDEDGVTRTQSTVSRKFTNMTLLISMSALVISTIVCIGAISSIKNTAVEKSTELGQDAAGVSEEALKTELETELTSTVTDKALLAEEKLRSYISSVQFAADYAGALYDAPDNFAEKEVMYPLSSNTGKWAMQRCLANEGIPYSQVERENKLLGNMEDVLASIVEHSENIATIYLGVESGLLISYDPYSGDTDVDTENYYEFREAEWYTMGQETGEPFFTKAYQDSYGRGLTITCVSPIRDSRQKFIGCICIDILMNDINRSMVNDNIVDPNYATLIDGEGSIIASKDVDGESSGTITIYDASIETPIKDAAAVILSGADGITEVGQGDDAVYISYARVPLTDWILCIMSPVSNIIKPAISIRENIQTNTETVASTVDDSIRQIINSCLILFAVIILAITFFVGRLANKITDPLQNLEMDVLKISDGHFDQRTSVSTDDEIGSLARAFNAMTESLQNYIVNLKEMTEKEGRIMSELSVATKIQADMLPRNFEAMSGREFEIYASMKPAKEVGGDFYDFFRVDDDHLAMVIADVSGKGVPAALFMMISMIYIKNAAQGGLSPKDILEKANNQLCENNLADMFVTVWIGILELSTGKMVCANGGHEFPTIRRAGGAFEIFEDEHDFVLGAMEGMPYHEYEIELREGDTLFVYTDGAPEATDANDELYGMERLLESLNRVKDADCRGLLAQVDEDINRFVGEAEQFDDLTMLSMTLKELRKAPALHLDLEMDRLPEVVSMVEGQMEAAGAPAGDISQTAVAVDEIFSNIVSYSQGTGMDIECRVEGNHIRIRFADDGVPYDPTAKEDPDTSLSAEEREVGGLGIYMVKQMMDSMTYEYKDGKNILEITNSWE